MREGLVPPGRPTAPNQAEYSDAHLRRIRLVRALREVGGLSIQAIQAVVSAIDEPATAMHDVLGVADRAVSLDAAANEPVEEDSEIDGLLRRLGWNVSPGAPAKRELARALRTLRGLGRDVDVGAFIPYARAVEPLARWEAQGLPAGTTDEAVEYAVVGTVVYGAVLAALRRLAHEHYSATPRRVDGNG